LVDDESLVNIQANRDGSGAKHRRRCQP